MRCFLIAGMSLLVRGVPGRWSVVPCAGGRSRLWLGCGGLKGGEGGG